MKILHFVNKIPKTQEGSVLLKQITRSGTSIGANMEEADGAASRKDFINKVVISRKEARETRYWLRLIYYSGIINNDSNKVELKKMMDEAQELIHILSAIIKSATDGI